MRAGHRAALPPPPQPRRGAAYDPGTNTVAQVLAFVDAHPDQLETVLAAERDGKARSTLLAELEARKA